MRHKAQVAGVVLSWAMRWKPTRYLVIGLALFIGLSLVVGIVGALVQAL